MKNKKLLAGLLLATVTATATWLSYSFADDTTSTGSTNSKTEVRKMNWERPELTDEQKTQMEEVKTLMEKQKSWATLTTEEITKLEEFKANRPEWKFWWMWEKRGWGFHDNFKNLTDTEKTALESMSDEEKTAFFEAKEVEMQAERTARENIIDKLLAWTTLTQDEEKIRAEIITDRAEKKVEMEEMKTKMDEMKTIFEKQKSWTTLTADETAKLEELKSGMKNK